MKKLFLLLAFVPLFMGMKVVYENDTGKIVAIGPFIDYETSLEQSIVEVKEASPEQIFTYKIDKLGNYVEKPNAEKQDEENKEKLKKQKLKGLYESGLSKVRKAIPSITEEELIVLGLKREN